MQDDRMTTSEAGLALIKKHEGWRAHWYQDPIGVWTIGWGTTQHVQGVEHPHSPSGPITKEMGEQLLRRALRSAEEAIRDYVTVPLAQGQHDALVSFIYNVGVGLPRTHADGPFGFRGSTLLQHLNAKRYDKAAQQFGRWVYAGGEVWDGLVHRRAAERKLFEGDTPKALGIRSVTPADMQPVGPELRRLLDEIQLEDVPSLA